MKKLLAITTAMGLAIGMTSPALAGFKNGNGGPQGGGPGNSGTGDKASQFAGPGPGTSFKPGFKRGSEPGNGGPQGGGPGTSGTGDKNRR